MNATSFSKPAHIGRTRNRIARPLAALSAVLFCCLSHVATAVPLPASVAGDVAFNLFPPNPSPLSVNTFGPHELAGPGGQLRFDSGLGPSPFLSMAASGVPLNFFGRAAGILRYDVEIIPDTGDPNAELTIQVNTRGQA